LGKEKSLESLKSRFESKFIRGERFECWQWQSYRNKSGYGVISYGTERGKNILAHRASYLLQWGNLDEALCVMHTCDNPPCVNPRHLKLGTNQDNIDDMVRKGRNYYKPGPNIHRSKINIDIARKIKLDLKNGISVKQITENRNISKHIVWDIKRNKTWKHISIEEST
jgi:HNH endonuclease